MGEAGRRGEEGKEAKRTEGKQTTEKEDREYSQSQGIREWEECKRQKGT